MKLIELTSLLSRVRMDIPYDLDSQAKRLYLKSLRDVEAEFIRSNLVDEISKEQLVRDSDGYNSFKAG